MKLNFAVFKKGKTIYWVIGGIVLFVLFYWMLNRGSSGSTTTAVVGASQPTDAQVSAAASQNMAQIAANTQIAQTNAALAAAQIQANESMYEAGAAADVAKYTSTLGAQTDLAGINAQLEALKTQSEFSLETAKVAANTSLTQQTINANLVVHQLDTNASMFHDQLATNAQMFADQTKLQELTASLQWAGENSSKSKTAAVKGAAGAIGFAAADLIRNMQHA